MKKIIRTATIGLSLNIFCRSLLTELKGEGYDVVAVSTPDEDLRAVGEREQVRTIGVAIERKISPMKDLVSLWRLYKVFRQEKPDMVHSMTPKAGLLSMMAGKLAGVPVRVHTFTGLVWPTSTGLLRQILKTTDRLTCACATHIIPEGQGVMNDLRQGGITRKPLRVLGYGNVRGVDMEHYSRRPAVLAKAETLREEGVFRFLFVGRIVGDKGINELVKAFVTLQQKMQPGQIRLALVGWNEQDQDPVTDETQRLIETNPDIEAVGPKSGDDLLAWYAASDCFVFPSYREGFPNTVIEAGAMELPSIVTDINGSREIICSADNLSAANDELRITNYELRITNYELGKTNNGLDIRENGVVIPSKNAEAIYDAMCWMMEHKEERRRMGERAREIMGERFEQHYVRCCLMDYYKQILDNE